MARPKTPPTAPLTPYQQRAVDALIAHQGSYVDAAKALHLPAKRLTAAIHKLRVDGRLPPAAAGVLAGRTPGRGRQLTFLNETALDAIVEAGGNTVHAAELLGVPHPTLYSRVVRLRDAGALPAYVQALISVSATRIWTTNGGTRQPLATPRPERPDTVLMPAAARARAFGLGPDHARALVVQRRLTGLIALTTHRGELMCPTNAALLPPGQGQDAQPLTPLTEREYAKALGINVAALDWLRARGLVRGLPTTSRLYHPDTPHPGERALTRAVRATTGYRPGMTPAQELISAGHTNTEVIRRLMLAGHTASEIHAETGWPLNSIHPLASRLRRAGLLPRREGTQHD